MSKQTFMDCQTFKRENFPPGNIGNKIPVTETNIPKSAGLKYTCFWDKDVVRLVTVALNRMALKR
jgi:hypothetical protein